MSTPEIARAAGVTRGAMYHQYSDKAKLFTAVLESIEAEVIERLGTAVAAAQPQTPGEALRVAADAWIEIATEPEVRQLVLLDAPGILGWAGFREISLRYGLGMTEQLLGAAIDAGELERVSARALATIMIGALDEAALSIANAEDPAGEEQEVRVVVHALIDGLLGASAATSGTPAPAKRSGGVT